MYVILYLYIMLMNTKSIKGVVKMFDKQFVDGLSARENMSTRKAVMQNLYVNIELMDEYFERGHSFKGHKEMTKRITDWELRLDVAEGHVDESLTDLDELRRVLKEIEEGYPHRSALAARLSLSMQQYNVLMTSKRQIPYNIITPVRHIVTQFINNSETLNVLSVDEMWDNVKIISQHIDNDTVMNALSYLSKIKVDLLKRSLIDREAFVEYLSKPQRIRLHKMVSQIKFQQGMKQFSIGRTVNEIAEGVVRNLSQKE